MTLLNSIFNQNRKTCLLNFYLKLKEVEDDLEVILFSSTSSSVMSFMLIFPKLVPCVTP